MLKLFSRSKPKRQPFDFSQLNADMHSHLLPGIDDGAEDMEIPGVDQGMGSFIRN
jgi:hypothetical protein